MIDNLSNFANRFQGHPRFLSRNLQKDLPLKTISTLYSFQENLIHPRHVKKSYFLLRLMKPGATKHLLEAVSFVS